MLLFSAVLIIARITALNPETSPPFARIATFFIESKNKYNIIYKKLQKNNLLQFTVGEINPLPGHYIFLAFQLAPSKNLYFS